MPPRPARIQIGPNFTAEAWIPIASNSRAAATSFFLATPIWKDFGFDATACRNQAVEALAQRGVIEFTIPDLDPVDPTLDRHPYTRDQVTPGGMAIRDQTQDGSRDAQLGALDPSSFSRMWP